MFMIIRRGVRAGVLGGPGHCPQYKKGSKKDNKDEKRWQFWQSKADIFEPHNTSPQVGIFRYN